MTTGGYHKRPNAWTPFLIFLTLVVGILMGYFLSNRLQTDTSFQIFEHKNDPLQEIISLIDAQYVDSVNKDSLFIDAVDGILKHLDPHTVYIPASELAGANEELEGSFKGIGIEFYRLKDTIQVTNVLSGGPSEKAGIMIGDKLIKINDTIVAGVTLPHDSLLKKLRGPENSTVKLTLLRYGQEKMIDKQITRGTIPLYSVDAAYMLSPTTGYVKINRFSGTTVQEFKTALAQLKKLGMAELVLDLRQNPGGYMDAAVAVVDEFLDGDKLVVYTEGRKFQKEEYTATRPGTMEQARLVVLIDEGSASASEIVAGAMQDWDRAVVIGRQSFGKGLVQEQFQLSDGSAIRLTIARYYTPIGRLIQRSYENGKSEYAHDYYKRLSDTVTNDSSFAKGKEYFSELSHRKLYGQGGIHPDIVVPNVVIKNQDAMSFLMTTDVVNTEVYNYYNSHLTQLKAYKDLASFQNSFSSNDLMATIKESFKSENAAYTNQLWTSNSDVMLLQKRVNAMLAKMLFGTSAFYQMMNDKDEVIQRAIETIQSDKYKTILSKPIISPTTP